MKYDPKNIERKWQKRWLEEKVFRANDNSKKPKYYQLETFPYPSAAGLHVGHPKGYIAEDIHARYMRMRGKEILYTMGWDAFGLPTENYAIKVGKNPREVAEANVKNFKRQLQMFGFSYDWDREINTSSPEYYKWTQWLFIQLFKKGLAYRAKANVNWCPSCLTVLANEQVKQKSDLPAEVSTQAGIRNPKSETSVCERCETHVEQREMEQWFFKITDYAERLLADLKELDPANPALAGRGASWPAATVKRQEDWIGKSEGAMIEFPISNCRIPNKVVLMHGKDTDPSQKWYPWFAEEVKKKGIKFIAPVLPEAKSPKLAEWIRELEATNPDERTVLVGHSRGGVAILRWLEKLEAGKMVGKVILVATNRGDKPDATAGDFFTGDYDFKKIRSHCDEFMVFHSRDDSWVPFEAGEHIAEGLKARVFFHGDRGHFGKLVKNIPELIQEVFPSITVFTTRPDTLFGATYMVLAPEHPILANGKLQIANRKEIDVYVERTKHKTDLMRKEEAKNKTGIELKGVKAVNPATKEEIPIWVADYVLMGYGTGAIMAVPAHDERDFEFAKKFNLPIRPVIGPLFVQTTPPGEVVSGKPFVERQVIMAVVKHWKEDKYIGLKWKKVDWQTVITGGVEPGQTPEQSAIAEIIEETGYLHPKPVKELGVAHSKFFHVPKKENRFGHFHMFYFVLEDGERQELSDIEKEIHDVLWLSTSEMGKFLSPASHQYAWSLVKSPAQVFIGEGILTNSGQFSGMDSEKAKWEITKFVGGERKVQYKIRDWSVSRQRYWGCPIPMINCAKCGWTAVPEKELPVELPPLKDYRPKGVPPLASSEKFMNVKCPQCGGEARRDAETLDTFVDSSWYFLRYTDPHNDKQFASKERIDYWMGCPLAPPKPCVGGVDLYVIGAEHTVLHLLYARFVTKFLHDEGHLNFSEPFLKLRHQGLIRGEDGQKMSKSKGNVVNPDELIAEFGADTVRLYEMFMGPFEEGAPWDPKGILGVERFLKRFWSFVSDQGMRHSERSEESTEILRGAQDDSRRTRSLIHKTIKKVGEDIENLKFNTAISALMILLNELEESRVKSQESGSGQLSIVNCQLLVKLLHPFAPHMAQELWSLMGHKTFLDFEPWPQFDPAFIKEETFTLVIQVNGKVRDSVEAKIDISEPEAKALALNSERVKAFLGGKEPKRIIYVPKKLINIVF